MLTTSVLTLIGEPVVWIFRQAVGFKGLDKSIVIPDTMILNVQNKGMIPHGASHNLSDAGDEDVGGLGNTGIMWVGLHVESFDWTRKVG